MAERKLHIGDEVWTWKPSRQYVEVRNQDRKKFLVKTSGLFGVTPDEIDRATRKGCGYKITPSLIKKHIIEQIRSKP